MEVYCAAYLGLMQKWCERYPEAIRVQSYEALVGNPREQIDALLEFCGLAPEQSCYEFHQSDANVMTPSASQVSQPIYSSSVGQWQRYRDFLAEEFEALYRLQQMYATVSA